MPTLWADPTANVRVARLVTQNDILKLVRLFASIASQEGWQPGNALQLHRSRSIYFGIHVSGRLVGGLQLVLPSDTGHLPCHGVWPDVPALSLGLTPRQLQNSVRPDKAHISILALEADVRGRGTLFWQLVVEMWRYCVAEGISTLLIEVTPRVFPLYRRLGWPLVIVGELRRHWGEDCHLCTLGVPEVATALLRRAERSQFYRQIIAQAFRVVLPSLVAAAVVAKRRMRPAPTSVVRERTAIYAVR